MYLSATASCSCVKVQELSAPMSWDLTDSVTRFIPMKNTLVVWDSSQKRLAGSSGKHIFPPQGNDCCTQSLLLLKEAGMRRRRLIAVLTSSGLRWEFQCNQFCSGQFYYYFFFFFLSGTKLHLSNFLLVLIVGCDLFAQIADQRNCFRATQGTGIMGFWCKGRHG